MRDERKTKVQLIQELEELRRRLALLEESKGKPKIPEDALKAERDRFYALLDGLPALVYVQARDYSIRFANRAFRELYGEPATRPCYQAMRGRDAPCEECRTFRVFDTDEPVVWEWTDPDHGRTYQVYDCPFTDPDGEPLILDLAIDITERKRAEEALQHLMQFNESIILNMGEGIVVLDAQGYITFTNPASDALLGYEPEELVGEHWTLIVPPDQHHIVEAADERRARGESDHYELALLRNDGTRISVLVHGRPRFVDGHLAGTMAVFTDITERKKDEEALQEHAYQLEALREVSLEITAQLDLDALLQSIVSRAVELLNGNAGGLYLYRPDRELLEWSVVAGENLAPIGSVLGRGEGLSGKVWDTGRPLIVNNYQNWDGRAPAYKDYPWRAVIGAPVRWGENFLGVLDVLSSTAAAFSDADRDLLGLFATQAAIAVEKARLYGKVRRELAERKRAEEALRESEQLFRNIVETAPSLLTITDAEGRNVYVSPNCEDIVGYTQEELQGGLIWWVHEDDTATAREALDRTFAQHASGRNFEYKAVKKDGEVWWASSSWEPLMDRTEQFQGVVLQTIDVTERKRAEQALKQYSERLEEMVDERTRELREAQEELVRRERLAILGQLAGGVSHELRNPLSTITNAVYFLKMILPEADERTKEYLDLISEQVQTAGKIVSDLLDFSRETPADRERVSVSELVAELLERQPPPHDVKLMVQVPKDLPRVFVDPRQIGQVLRNLVTNAYQAMPEGGSMIIEAEEREGRVRLAVMDTGLGIPEENMDKLFEPLFSTKPRGIGLGLAVSKTLVEANEGTIEVESEQGKGSTFTVILPTEDIVT